MQDSIVIKSLIKSYIKDEGNFVLNGININIKGPQLIIVKGKNGCGKTTLCNIISSLDLDYSGEVYFNGRELKSLTEKERCLYRREKFSYAHQKLNLINELTVLDNCLIVCDDLDKINNELKHLKIKDIADMKVNNLSLGQMQKLAIARAILQKSSIICFDEPLASIDESSKIDIVTAINNCAETRITIVITHDENSFKAFDYKKICIEKGRINERE